MSETVPQWLNEKFLVHALTGNCESSSEIDLLSYEILPKGIPEGNNFASVIHKTNVRYKRKGKDESVQEQIFLIKSPIQSGPLIGFITEGKFIEKEYKFYQDYVPLMEEIIGTIDIIPKHFPSNVKYILALEDLSQLGYVMHDKTEQLDFEKSALVFKNIATFHAASVALHKRNPALVESLGEPLVHTDESVAPRETIEPFFKMFAGNVKNWKGFERFGELSNQFIDSFWERTVKAYNRRESMIVLNHGDFWTNNVMFKHDKDGKAEQIKFVDFQMVVYGPIGIDLHYLTWTSVKPSVRELRLDELFSLYLETLNSCLEKFGCESRLSREQFDDEIDSTMFIAFHSVYFAIFVQLCGMVDPGDENAVRRAFENKIFRENAEQALLYFERKGFFILT